MEAHILDGESRIINTIVVESLDVIPGLIDASLGGRIGDMYISPGVFESPEVPEPEPAEAVPMLNLQLILIDDGKLATVEGIIAAMPGVDGDRARAYWAKALTARRDNDLVAQLWPAIEYTEAQFNNAWARAAALNP